MPTLRQVVVVQRSLRAYRRPFYDRIRPALAAYGIDLRLLHTSSEEVEADALPPWSVRVPGWRLAVGDRQLVWQSILRRVRGSDLVIVEQAVQLLANYPLLAWQRAGGPRVALWGHGRTFHLGDDEGAVGVVKSALTHEAHWFFAYNELAAAAVRESGYPADRITNVRNSTDTVALRNAVDAADDGSVAAVRRELGLRGQDVCVFLGSVDHAKRLWFLLDAVGVTRARVPDLELVFVGDGPAADELRRATADRPWIHWAGTRRGPDLGAILRTASAILVPGWAGLVVVDSFAAGVPLVASASATHPPEIAYLEDGVNGRLVEDGGDPTCYGNAVADLLADQTGRQQLAAGARRAADDLGVGPMVERFTAGIAEALAAPRR